MCTRCGKTKRVGIQICDDCSLQNKILVREHNQEVKRIIIEYYSKGTMKCLCCGDTNFEFLSIDHINGGGYRHTKEVNRYGSSYYKWLIKNNYPEGIRILCMNCNFSLGKHGYCPHNNL